MKDTVTIDMALATHIIDLLSNIQFYNLLNEQKLTDAGLVAYNTRINFALDDLIKEKVDTRMKNVTVNLTIDQDWLRGMLQYIPGDTAALWAKGIVTAENDYELILQLYQDDSNRIVNLLQEIFEQSREQ